MAEWEWESVRRMALMIEEGVGMVSFQIFTWSSRGREEKWWW